MKGLRLKDRSCISISFECLVHKDCKTAGYSKRKEAMWLPMLQVRWPRAGKGAKRPSSLSFPVAAENTPARRGFSPYHWESWVKNVTLWLHTLGLEPVFFHESSWANPWCLATQFISVTTKNDLFSHGQPYLQTHGICYLELESTTSKFSYILSGCYNRNLAAPWIEFV